MTKETIITCDRCNLDLTWTSNCVDYRIILTDENIPSKGGAVTAMLLHPHINGAKHFCNFKCMKDWVNESNS